MDREYFENLRLHGYKYQKKVKVAKKSNMEAWKLIHNVTKEVIISGAYPLCVWKLKSISPSLKKYFSIKPL